MEDLWKFRAPFGLEVTQFLVFSSHNSNPKLITQFSNPTFTQKLENNVWTQFSVTYFYHFSLNPWAPPLTLPNVMSVATRVSLMKIPLLPLLLSSALLLPLLLLYFSKLKESPCSASRPSPHTSTHANIKAGIFSNTLRFVSLSPLLYFDPFFRLLLLPIFERLFMFLHKNYSSSRKLKDNIKSYTYHNFPIKISTNKSWRTHDLEPVWYANLSTDSPSVLPPKSTHSAKHSGHFASLNPTTHTETHNF